MKKVNFWRRFLQFSVLGWLLILVLRGLAGAPVDFEAYCPMGGLQAMSSYLVRGSLACSMTSVQIVMGITLFIGVILLSKFFCAYICPLGTIAEWLGRLGDKLKVRRSIEGTGDKVLRSLKYILLFVTFYFTVTSSELFCKNFDPYFAATDGYGHDVTIWMATLTTLMLVVGSVFVRMFWCKYICPLGAVSNIFKFLAIFGSVFAVYGLLSWAGLSISWIIPMVITCVTTYAIEIMTLKSKVFPALKITRDEDKCVNCGICASKCSYGLDVDKLKVVEHVDCTLCGDCVAACPKEGALTINKKIKSPVLPMAMGIVLIVIGIFLGSSIEIATLDEKWGTEEQISEAKVFEKSGLKNIKCFGSSKGFAGKLKRVKGIVRVATYVKSHSVKIYYNPKIINEQSIEKIIFNPTKVKIANPPRITKNVKQIEVGVENLSDRSYVNYLALMFKKQKGYYGLVSEYGCPIKLIIYMDENKKLNEGEIKKIIETKEFTYKVRGADKTVELDMDYVYAKELEKPLSREKFMHNFFEGFSKNFKGSQMKYKDKPYSVYEMPFPQARLPITSRYLPYFASHLSNVDGVLAFRTYLKEDDSTVIQIVFVEEAINEETLLEKASSKTWTITYGKDNVKEQPAKFKVLKKGKVIKRGSIPKQNSKKS